MLVAYQAVLRKQLHIGLSSLHPLLRSDVVLALQQPGKLLYSAKDAQAVSPHQPPAGSWALLTFLVALCVQPTIQQSVASSVAVALECLICALDLLDDVEDEDQTAIVHALGVARTLNVATALLACAQHFLLALPNMNVRPSVVLSLQRSLQLAMIEATGGQHRDLLAEERSVDELSLEECLEIAAEKAGALMRLACQLGAIVAEADEACYSLFSELGLLLGIAHQLDNDSHDLSDILQTPAMYEPYATLEVEEWSRTTMFSDKTDIRRSKKTIPLVLTAKETEQSARDFKSMTYRSALYQSILATWGISLLYRERARECLQKIELLRSISPLLRLLLGLS